MTRRPELRLSVIVTTYNNPRALTLVLTGLGLQSFRDFELIIADDGSAPDTARAISDYSARAPFPVRHVWHPDQGFRKCTISNQAILAATGDYLIFFDGDCIPPRHCVETHARSAQRGSYLTGGKLSLGRRLSSKLTPEQVGRGMLDSFGPWWLEVTKPRRLLVSRIPLLREWMNRRVPRQPAWRGENSSGFAQDIHRVGGFDQRFSYGFEDADLGHRLQAAGVQGRSVRYSAPVFHLDHPRPWGTQDVVAANRALYEENRALRLVRTPHGLPPA